MITPESFQSLKAGDVVLFSGKPRTVRCGPADRDRSQTGKGSKTGMVTFSKIRRGKYGGTTCYTFEDVYRKIDLPPRGRVDVSAVCLAEVDALKAIGFNPLAVLKAEIAWHKFVDKNWSKYGKRFHPRAIRVAGVMLERFKRKRKR